LFRTFYHSFFGVRCLVFLRRALRRARRVLRRVRRAWAGRRV
jgi:hypothetical protein